MITAYLYRCFLKIYYLTTRMVEIYTKPLARLPEKRLTGGHILSLILLQVQTLCAKDSQTRRTVLARAILINPSFETIL